jgi:transaldolase
MPPATVVACLDHASVARTVDQGVDDARAVLAEVEATGISLDEVTQELEIDGVQKFADSFVQLLAAIEAKRREVVAG